MSSRAFEIIGSTPSNSTGAAGTESTGGDAGGNTGGTDKDLRGIGEPEIITFAPVNFDGDAGANDNGGNSRLTKSGRIDRRTRAGRTGSSDGPAETASGKYPLEKVSLEKAIISIAGFCSVLSGVPEMELDSDESKELSEAVKEVSRHYGNTFDPKKVALANLAAVVGKLSWTRVIAYRLRKSTEPAQPKHPENNIHLTPQSAPPKQTKKQEQPQGGFGTLPSDFWSEPARDDLTFGM